MHFKEAVSQGFLFRHHTDSKINKCIWPWMVRMEMDYNLENIRQTFLGSVPVPCKNH